MFNALIEISIKPFPAFDISTKLANAAPVSCPTIVTRDGSPPNATILSRVQCKAANISISPKLPPEPGKLEARVFIKPASQTKAIYNKRNRVCCGATLKVKLWGISFNDE